MTGETSEALAEHRREAQNSALVVQDIEVGRENEGGLTMKFIHAATVVAMMLLVSAAASAALTDWGTGQVTTFADPDEGFMPGREILQVWHKYDAGVHYFRIDLEESPMGPTQLPPSFSGVYGIAINVNPATGVDGSHPFMTYAPNMPGIDYLIDAHYEASSHLPNPLSFQYAHFHEWETNSFSFAPLASVGGAFERTGETFEWSIGDAMIGSPGADGFVWCAYTLDAGSEARKYDIACLTPQPPPVVIPEPVTMTALGMGLVGLGGYLRRRLRR